MAFMLPVMKNNYAIYPNKPRSRKNSASSTAGVAAAPPPAPTERPPGIVRPSRRSVSESDKSGSGPSPSRLLYSSSAPSSGTLASLRSQRAVRFSRSVSQDGASGARRRASGPAAVVVPASLPASGYHSRTSSSSTSSVNDDSVSDGSEFNAGEAGGHKFGSLGRFHSRLIDKLKRKFRMKDDADVCSPEDDTAVIRAST